MNDVMKNVLFEVCRRRRLSAVRRGLLTRIQDLISRYEYLYRTHQEYVQEHQQERERAQTFKQVENQHNATIVQLQNILVGRPQHHDASGLAT